MHQRERERETSECQPLRLRRDETKEEEGGELDNMEKNGEGVGVGDAPHKILECIKKRRKT